MIQLVIIFTMYLEIERVHNGMWVTLLGISCLVIALVSIGYCMFDHE